MTPRLTIRSWTESFLHHNGIAVVFDVFRCTTTIACLHSKRAGDLFVAPSLASVENEARVREMRVFSELSQPVHCLERFDNSPIQALQSEWKAGVPALVATTTGTPAMFAARNFSKVYLGNLTNFSATVKFLSEFNGPVTLIPAAFPTSGHVEDEIACQAMATALEGFSNLPDFVRQCGEQARERILASPRPTNLAGKIPTGKEDIEIALDLDRFSHTLSIDFGSESSGLFARVQEER